MKCLGPDWRVFIFSVPFFIQIICMGPCGSHDRMQWPWPSRGGVISGCPAIIRSERALIFGRSTCGRRSTPIWIIRRYEIANVCSITVATFANVMWMPSGYIKLYTFAVAKGACRVVREWHFQTGAVCWRAPRSSGRTRSSFLSHHLGPVWAHKERRSLLVWEQTKRVGVH